MTGTSRRKLHVVDNKSISRNKIGIQLPLAMPAPTALIQRPEEPVEDQAPNVTQDGKLFYEI